MGTPVLLPVLCFVAAVFVGYVGGHGRLMEPAARNAMWRLGYPNPVNYNDNSLYCGGFIVQYGHNKGKCGVCGDDFREKEPRSHEAGGLYGNGITARRYVSGQVIDIEAELTTNHQGWMEVKLCNRDDPDAVITEECLERYALQLADGSGHQFIIPDKFNKSAIYRWKVKLPESVTCSQCVIRWKYFTGNTWGTCPNGTESVGCGPQETFINCADVVILINTPSLVVSDDFNPWALYFKNSMSWLLQTAVAPASNNPVGLTPLIIRAQICLPIEPYEDTPGMVEWCMINCLKYPPNCHPSYCKCVHECNAVGEFAKKDQADIWCHQHCLTHPSHCPPDRCLCF